MSNTNMDPKAKARLERDMANLRKQMKSLGKQLEKDCGMKDFDPLKNMNPKYPFNILPDKDKNKNNPFGPGFPFNQPGNEKNKDNPFGSDFPFNQTNNPFGQNNPFFENLFKNAQAYTFDPPPEFMEDPFAFANRGGFAFNPNNFSSFKPYPHHNPGRSSGSGGPRSYPQPQRNSYNYPPPRTQTYSHPSNNNDGPIIEEIDPNDE